LRLQEYPAKGTLNARTFAAQPRGQNVKIGYARVSTLSETGTLTEGVEESRMPEDFPRESFRLQSARPEFQRMLDQIRPGDVIVVWKPDRLARSTRDLLNTMETINDAAGKFQSISEPWANTTTHADKMIMTVFAGIAEFERDLIRERTGAGREAAKQRGVRFGRPRKLNTDQVKVVAQLLSEGKAVRDIVVGRVDRIEHKKGTGRRVTYVAKYNLKSGVWDKPRPLPIGRLVGG
jgi:DNA invertase Pin-like site-specific DNA recombinase